MSSEVYFEIVVESDRAERKINMKIDRFSNKKGEQTQCSTYGFKTRPWHLKLIDWSPRCHSLTKATSKEAVKPPKMGNEEVCIDYPSDKDGVFHVTFARSENGSVVISSAEYIQ